MAPPERLSTPSAPPSWRPSLSPAGGHRVLLTVAGLVVVIAGLRVASPLLVPVLFSVFLAVLAAPSVIWLQERRVPAVVAVPLVVIVVFAVLLGLGSLIGSSLNEFVAGLPDYQERLDTIVGTVAGVANKYGIELSRAKMTEMVRPAAVMELVGTALTQVASMLTNTLLVLLTMIFILFEVAGLPTKVRTAMGDPRADLSDFARVTSDVKNYIVIKTYVSAATGVVVGLSLWLLDVDFPLLWGLVAFMFNYVPNIGSIIAAIPAVLLSLLQHGVARALVVLAMFVGVNMVLGNMVEPKLMGRRLGLSTLVVFLSLVFWGWLWGAAGMLLSVPLTMVVKIWLDHSRQWRWLGVLMDPAIEPVVPAKE